MKKRYLMSIMFLTILAVAVYYRVSVTNVEEVVDGIKNKYNLEYGLNYDKIESIELSVFEILYISKVVKIYNDKDIEQLYAFLSKVIIRPVFMQDYISWDYRYKLKKKISYDWINIKYKNQIGGISLTIYDENLMNIGGKMYKILGNYEYEEIYEIASKYYIQQQ